MSEFLQNKEHRINEMLRIIRRIQTGEDIEIIKSEEMDFIKNVTPHDILNLETYFINKGITVSKIKQDIEKQLSMFVMGLNNYKYNKPDNNHPLFYYIKENEQLNTHLDNLKDNIIQYTKNTDVISEIIKIIKILPEFEVHYVRKENIIFPYIEKIGYDKPMGVMWSIDDDIRKLWKKLNKQVSINVELTKENIDDINQLISLMKGMIMKEDKIIFPAAIDTLTEKDWDEITTQSVNESFVFIDPPKPTTIPKKKEASVPTMDGLVKLGNTGALAVNEIIMLLDTLPIDITYVDEDNTVRYYSNAKDRIFPRSPAIIGRKVQNCHPPESVHIVNEVIEELKNGKDSVDFWINFKGKFIYIRYFAIRDSEGNYKGSLEVTQDLTVARALEGERRLLDRLAEKVGI